MTLINITKTGQSSRLFQIIVKLDKENSKPTAFNLKLLFPIKTSAHKLCKMYKSIVNELALSDTIEIKVRSSEGAEIVLQVKSEEKFSKIKEEIWKNIGTKTQLKIGDAIVDIMTEYIQSTELSYDAFGALPEAEQVCKSCIFFK